MHTMEDESGLYHLIVFITSNLQLKDKILELQRRNFRVIVLYYVPHANQQLADVIKAADEAHDWLPFLKCKLDTAHLNISTYDAHLFHSGEVPGAIVTNTPMYIQNQQDHPSSTGQAYMMQAGALLLDAIHRSHPASDDELLRTVADICLANGLQSQSEGQLVVSPTSVCQVGEAIRHRQVKMADKLKTTLQSNAYSSYFQIISGPVGTQPAILPNFAELISNKHNIDPIDSILAIVNINLTHPQTAGHAASVKSLVPNAKQHQHVMPDSNETRSKEVAEAGVSLISDVKGCLQCEDHAFVLSAASACILSGLKSHANGFLLHPVLLAGVGQHCINLEYSGTLSEHLKSPASQRYFRLVDGPGQPAVMLNISTLSSQKSLELRKRIKVK